MNSTIRCMSARQRDSVPRSASRDSQMTYTEFMQAFPNTAACLDYLRDLFYPQETECPGCGKPSRFHRIKGRSAYSCQHCGHHVYQKRRSGLRNVGSASSSRQSARCAGSRHDVRPHV